MKRAAWAAVIVLSSLGVLSAVTRAAAVLAPESAVARLVHRLAVAANHDEALVREIDTRFSSHAALTLWHVLPGALFFTLGPLQLSRRIRARHPRFHRWSGRALVVTVIAGTIDGFYFGILHPFAGSGEVAPIALFGALMLLTVILGFVAIRRGDVARHRRWMIRAFAIALGISTIRIVGAILQIAVAMPPRQMLIASFWIGWTLTLAVAETYIRATSTSARTYSLAVRGTGSATP